MSLAIYAAPFNNESNNENYIGNKRRHNNKTQKRMYPMEGMSNNDLTNTDRVNSVLQSMQNIPPPSSDGEELGDFQPLPPPSSVGAAKKEKEKEKEKESREGMVSSSLQSSYYSNVDSSSNFSQQNQHNDYYKRFIPNYEELYKKSGYNLASEEKSPSITYYPPISHNSPSHSPSLSPSLSGDKDILLEKLNYMIHLLEEQQDERTNNVTEEVILYSFLGIFIIFIVDSFARVGKYTR